MVSQSLARLEQAERALAEIARIEDAQEVIDLAVAWSAYIRQRDLGQAAANHAQEIRMRAEIRLADLVDEGQRRGEIATAGGDRQSIVVNPDNGSSPQTYTELGISRQGVSDARLLRDFVGEERIVELSRMPNRDLKREKLLLEGRRKRARARVGERVEREALVTDIPAPVVKHGDFREVLADVRDVDLVLTDPPYPFKHIECWSHLSEWAAQALRPGHLLVAYSGSLYVPEVIDRLREHLDYFGMISLVLPGQSPRMWSRPFWQRTKPIFLFSNGQPSEKALNLSPIENMLVSPAPDRDLHKWQQSLEPAKKLIDWVTERGERVVDPFLGSGTVGHAAMVLEREFIGAEIERDHYETCCARLGVSPDAS